MDEQISLSENGITLHVVKTKYRENEWAVVYASTDVAGNGLNLLVFRPAGLLP